METRCSTRHLSPGRVDVPPWRADLGGVLHFAPCGADQGLNHPDPTEFPSGFVTPVFERMRASNSVRFPARWPHTKPARGRSHGRFEVGPGKRPTVQGQSRIGQRRSPLACSPCGDRQASPRLLPALRLAASAAMYYPAAMVKQALGFRLLSLARRTFSGKFSRDLAGEHDPTCFPADDVLNAFLCQHRTLGNGCVLTKCQHVTQQDRDHGQQVACPNQAVLL